MLLALFLASCGDGGDNGGLQPDTVLISGLITYESIAPDPLKGLDYDHPQFKPVRRVPVELYNLRDERLERCVTDEDGRYAFQALRSLDIFIRVKAKSVSPNQYRIEVVDNTQGKALYVLDTAPFNTGSLGELTKNIQAPLGWDGTGYSGVRASAPFAILDSILTGVDTVVRADPGVQIPPLTVNWNVNNIPYDGDLSAGEIGTTFFDAQKNEIYVLGREGNDTDEFDSHVLLHEFGHFIAATLGRDDSMGGDHGLLEVLDPRLAFSEGFGNAFSGIALEDSEYVDTFGGAQDLTFSFNLEANDLGIGKGFYSEFSLQSILYDLFDAESDGSDEIFLGFPPILEALKGQRTEESFVTIYSFIHALKRISPHSQAGINALIEAHQITTPDVEAWDNTQAETYFPKVETPPAGPLYQELVVDAPAAELCSTAEFGIYNKLNNRRLFYFHLDSPGNYTVTATPTYPDADLDFILYHRGEILGWADNLPISEYIPEGGSFFLEPGIYVGEIYEYGHIDGSRAEVGCFDLEIY